MSMKQFIRQNRKAIDEHIVRVLGGDPEAHCHRNDRERHLWVRNDESLYNWARSEGVKNP